MGTPDFVVKSDRSLGSPGTCFLQLESEMRMVCGTEFLNLWGLLLTPGR